MSPTPLMGCGHAANGKRSDGSPVCVVCFGIVAGADLEVPGPDLSSRTARCEYGAHKDVPSNMNLPFFSHQPHRPMDSYYCGCYGWE